MNKWLALGVLAFGLSAMATEQVYDERADAKAAVESALKSAAANHKSVLLVFGANWCADCVALDHALKAQKSAGLLAKEFEVVKIDVGHFDRNMEIVTAYGKPIEEGIPAVVVLSPDNKILFTTRGGELANARTMNDEGVYGFFRDKVAKATQQP